MKILLISGGADSMYIYYNNKFDKFVYLNYGQKHIETELNILDQIVKHNNNYDLLSVDNLTKDDNGFYECRNLKFILKIIDTYKGVTSITFGTNADDKHPDNNRDFFDMIERVIEMSYKKEIKILTPLKDIKKKDIVKGLSELEIEYFTD